MSRPAARTFAGALTTRRLVRPTYLTQRRLITTAPPPRKTRSWKSFTARLGLAFYSVYLYNTIDVFADEPEDFPRPPEGQTDERLPTIEELSEERRQRLAKANTATDGAAQSPAELEEEADQQGAFDPETGTINWDCPCLGGMAHGPCGEEFKEAFSCFIFSKEEPKGVDCIEKFKGMQECFRKYPEIYASEFDEEENEIENEDKEARPLEGSEPGSASQEYLDHNEAVAQHSSASSSSTHGEAAKHPVTGTATETGTMDATKPPQQNRTSGSDEQPAGIVERAKDTAGAATKAAAEGAKSTLQDIRESGSDAQPAGIMQRAKDATGAAAETITADATGTAQANRTIGSNSQSADSGRGAKGATAQVRQDHEPLSESDDVVPKAWHDAKDRKTEK